MAKILITGASKGLGKAMFEALHNSEHQVYGTYNTTPPSIGSPANWFKVDFSDNAQLIKFIDTALECKFDVLINNFHPGYEFKHAHKSSKTDLVDGFNNYILPTLLITNALIKPMRKAKNGTLIHVLSEVTIKGSPTGLAKYTAEKVYLKSCHESWHTENHLLGINSISLSPGALPNAAEKAIDPRVLTQTIESDQIVPYEKIISVLSKIISAPAEFAGQNILIE